MPLEQKIKQHRIALPYLLDVRANVGVEPAALDDRVNGKERKHAGQRIV